MKANEALELCEAQLNKPYVDELNKVLEAVRMAAFNGHLEVSLELPLVSIRYLKKELEALEYQLTVFHPDRLVKENKIILEVSWYRYKNS